MYRDGDTETEIESEIKTGTDGRTDCGDADKQDRHSDRQTHVFALKLASHLSLSIVLIIAHLSLTPSSRGSLQQEYGTAHFSNAPFDALHMKYGFTFQSL